MPVMRGSSSVRPKTLPSRRRRVNLTGMKTIVFDTETTGLWHDGDELAVTQPWPVQISAVILTDEFQIESEFNELAIPPSGADWTEKAMEITGITPDVVKANGRPMADVLRDFQLFAAGVEVVAAYNLPFDYRIVRTSGERMGMSELLPPASKDVEHLCVMEWASYKMGVRVQLWHAYRQITGKLIENAHDAMADTLAAVEILQHLYVNPEILR